MEEALAEEGVQGLDEGEDLAPVSQYTLVKYSLACFVKSETTHGERTMPTVHLNVDVCTKNY